MSYNHSIIELKWQKYWYENKIFKVNLNSSKPKYYVLDMFPYPSGSGLHIGHLEGYTATDIFSRFKRMQGYEVLHPIGWDGFGLPAEQYAIKTNNSPRNFTNENISTFRKQIQRVGFSYDFDREVNTTDPNFYKITQLIFSKLFEHKLAEYRKIEVNWCENLGTVLSNEEVIIKDGLMVSDRGHYAVVKRPMFQWVLKITKYSEKLLNGLSDLDWPESVKNLQKNWIGKSKGILFNLNVDNSNIKLPVFESNPENLFGFNFVLISPENKLVNEITTISQSELVKIYIDLSKQKTEIQRKREQNMSGEFTGSYAINPITNKKIPIWISDSILNNYASDSAFGCAGKNIKDEVFSKKYKINTLKIYDKNNSLINSDILNGLNRADANKKIVKYLLKENIGVNKTYYNLKDWLFSRQRYWGEPFPLIHLENGEIILDPNLPVKLPHLKDFSPSKDGVQPLSKLNDWVNIRINEKSGKRETNTMPQWAGSCWYYIAYLLKTDKGYLDIESKESKKIMNKWLPVDLYVGGQEHAVLHLMYARFWYLFLYDIGIVKNKEPFSKLFNQGMILGEDGVKMSKSLGNIISPDEIINEYGADTIRISELFLGALEDDKSWSKQIPISIKKWIDRVYRIFIEENKITKEKSEVLTRDFNLFIKNVTHNIENLKFNLAISDMMIFINSCSKVDKINIIYVLDFIKVFSLFAPHLGEEIWLLLSKKKGISYEKWPKYDSKSLIQKEVTIIIQVNGKVRGKIITDINANKNLILEEAKKISNIQIYLKDKKIVKEIYILNKLVNIVVK